MIFIFSFARSGSSLFQQFLAKVLRYDTVYEPIGFVPTKLPPDNNHAFIFRWFRGAPPVKDLPQYRIEDFYLANIPPARFDAPGLTRYKTELQRFLKDIHDHYGDDAVFKEINQHANIRFFHHLLTELKIPQKYIIFKRDPFEIAYSFYRRGGFQRLSYWYYERLYAYRKCLYPDNVWLRQAKTPLDKWMATVLADYEQLDRGLQWLQEQSLPATLVQYEEFMRDPTAVCEHVASALQLPIHQELLGQQLKNYQFDAPNKFNIAKINLGASDPLFIRYVKETCDNLSLAYPEHYPKTLPRLRASHVRYRLNNNLQIHPFIRAYEAIKRRVKRKKLFLKGFYYTK